MYAMDKRIKERRERLMQILKNGSSRDREEGVGYPPYRSFSHDDDDKWTHPLQKWVWQVPLTVLLVMACFMAYQSEHPTAAKAQSWIAESLTREFNFQGVQAWYEANFAGSPSLLPQFKTHQTALAPQPAAAVVFAPIRGQVLTEFQGEGITIQSGKNESFVVAMTDGWVVSVDEKDKLGLTVVLRHPGGKETWYSYLKGATVQEGDVVRGGQNIGTLHMDQSQQEGLLYFSMKENNQFTDPLGVVQFD